VAGRSVCRPSTLRALPLLTQAPAVRGTRWEPDRPGDLRRAPHGNQQTWALKRRWAQDATTQTGNPAFFETMEVAYPPPPAWMPPSRSKVQMNPPSTAATAYTGSFITSAALRGTTRSHTSMPQKSSYKISEAEAELSGAIVPHWTYSLPARHVPRRLRIARFFLPTSPRRYNARGGFQPIPESPNRPTLKREKMVVVRGSQERRALSQQCNTLQPFALVSSHYIEPTITVNQCGYRQHFHPELYLDASRRLRLPTRATRPFGRIRPGRHLRAKPAMFFHWMQNQTATIAPGKRGRTAQRHPKRASVPRLRDFPASPHCSSRLSTRSRWATPR